MKTPEKQTTVMVKIGKSELDEPRAVTFTNEHFTNFDIEMDMLDACFEVCILPVSDVDKYQSPRNTARLTHPYQPDERENTLKKLGKPSLALSPPCMQF